MTDTTPPDRPRPRISRGFLTTVLVLLAANYLVVTLLAPGTTHSVSIPYSPTFLQQVNANDVTRISAEGNTVTGVLTHALRYPNAQAQPATNFTTQIPIF